MASLTRKLSEAAPDTGGHQQYLTFLLGGEMYAIGILRIKEIMEHGGITAVPMMPNFVRGVINLRGSVVPVVDLQARFGRALSEITRRSCIVIIEVVCGEERMDMGMMVDSVSAVLEITENDIEPPPAFGTRIRTDFICGMGKIDGRFVIILDTDRVMNVEDLAVLTEMSSNEALTDTATVSA